MLTAEEELISIVQAEAKRTAIHIDALRLEHHNLMRKELGIIREIELINAMLKYHGKKPIEIDYANN